LCYNEEILFNDPLCVLIRENNLACESDAINGILLDNNISYENKVRLVRIKLDWLIDGEYKGKKKMLITFLIGLIMCVAVSGTGGLAVMLDALYQLFKADKISDVTYRYLTERLFREAGKSIPTPA